MSAIALDWLRTGQLVPYYLMASYLYYHCEASLFSDEDYDKLCAALYTLWGEPEVKAHPHRRLVKRDALLAGTGYYIPQKRYPLQVRTAAMDLAAKCGILP
jgi:hypothetical protein